MSPSRHARRLAPLATFHLLPTTLLPTTTFLLPTTTTLLPLLLLLLLLALPTSTNATNTCNIGYSSTCDPLEFTVTSNIFFHVNKTASNIDETTFNATVIFHWGDDKNENGNGNEGNDDNLTLPSQPYDIGIPIGLSNTHSYTDEGYYQVGYSIVFEDDDAAGCSKRTFDGRRIVRMERTPLKCEWVDDTPGPTGRPTGSMGPTESARPTTEENGLMVKNNAGEDDGTNGGDGRVMGVMDSLFGLFVIGLGTALGTLLVG